MSDLRRWITLCEADVKKPRMPRKPSDEVLNKAAQDGFDVSKLWFHGTRRRFDGFQIPKQTGIDELGPGVYLTSVKWLANTWARERGFIVICVVRAGPLFNFANKLDDPKTIALLRQGYVKNSIGQWGNVSETDAAETFDYVWQLSRDRQRLANGCLSGAGYVGAYKQDSQIAGQIVVFKPEDVMIVAREGGQAYMS